MHVKIKIKKKEKFKRNLVDSGIGNATTFIMLEVGFELFENFQ